MFVIMGLFTMLLMVVVMPTVLSSGMGVVVVGGTFRIMAIGMFMLVAMGMFMQMSVLMSMGFSVVRMVMLMAVAVLVAMLVTVLVLPIHINSPFNVNSVSQRLNDLFAFRSGLKVLHKSFLFDVKPVQGMDIGLGRSLDDIGR
jgi:hypothetical protein